MRYAVAFVTLVLTTALQDQPVPYQITHTYELGRAGYSGGAVFNSPFGYTYLAGLSSNDVALA